MPSWCQKQLELAMDSLARVQIISSLSIRCVSLSTGTIITWKMLSILSASITERNITMRLNMNIAKIFSGKI
jgi:hypothetical protein